MPEPWALRDVCAADQDFLDELYFSSREDLHQALADTRMLRQLVAVQHQVQQAGIRRDYPRAEHLVLLCRGQPVGRVVLDIGPADIRLVDMAVAPSARRSGAARAVVRAVQARAAAAGLGVSLAVAASNAAARALYQGAGFQVSSRDLVFEQMAWQSTGACP